MHTETHYSPLAVTYATSLLELALEANPSQAEEIGGQLRDIRQILDNEPLVAQVFSDPSITESERATVLTRAFEGRVNPLLMKFLNLLNAKGRLSGLSSMAGAYDDLLDEKLGKVEVDVTVAQRLDSQTLENVRQKVSSVLKRDAVVHQYIDPDIIGGLILRVRDQLIDGSVRTQLAQLKERLIASNVKRT